MHAIQPLGPCDIALPQLSSVAVEADVDADRHDDAGSEGNAGRKGQVRPAALQPLYPRPALSF